jgi:hypothetical protein
MDSILNKKYALILFFYLPILLLIINADICLADEEFCLFCKTLFSIIYTVLYILLLVISSSRKIRCAIKSLILQ